MLDQSLAIVKKVLGLYEASLKSNPANPAYVAISAELRMVVQCLDEQRRLAIPIPKDLGDVSDLPEELLKELSIPATDELETQILTVMRACNGEANLDQVLVGLYRKFKVSQQRRFLQNKLYRMSKKGLVYQVPGQRAAYTLTPPPTPDFDFNFDGEHDKPTSENGARTTGPDLDDEIPF